MSADIPLYNMEEDYAAQVVSGPHHLTAEMRQKHKELQAVVKHDLPILDPFRKNDCDMLYRYLIARKWDVGAAATAIRENNAWRERCKINTILTEACEDWGDMPTFMGIDKDGHPVQYNAPNTVVLLDLLKKKPKEVLFRRHYVAMERARYMCKLHDSDRISCILDLSNVGMSGITQVIGLLKEMSADDQKYYPETMRRMIVCNGGWAITSAWKGIKNFIDPRTQQKISFVSGPPSAKVLSEFIDISQLPRKYGGTGDEKDLTFDFSSLWGPDSPIFQKKSVIASASAKHSVSQPVAKSGGVVAGSRDAVGRSSAKPPSNESPRLKEEDEGLGDGDDSDTDTFYSMPSTDDDGEVSSPSEVQSSSIIIHAVNMCDAVIIQNERMDSAKRVNPSFHTNPRSAAVEDPTLRRSAGATLVPASLLRSPQSTSSLTAATTAASSSLSVGKSSAVAYSHTAQPNDSGRSASIDSTSQTGTSPEMGLYEKLRQSGEGFTVLLGFSDGCYTATVEDVCLGRKMENVIMHGTTDMLLMTIQREAGHPVHTHFMLVTPRRQVRYILRKGIVRDDIKIFDIHGDRTVFSVKDKGKCAGEKVERYSINQWPCSKDPKDWHVWRKGNRHGEEFLIWKEGQVVEVSEKMLSDGNTPETIISLILALTTVWYNPCAEY